MEVTHSKGLLYPSLQMSSFRVRRDSLPQTFGLPEEVSRAAGEPLPATRSVSYEEEVLQHTLQLLKADEREVQTTRVKVALEEAKRKKARVVQSAQSSEKRKGSKQSLERAKKIEDVMSMTGMIDPSEAEKALEQHGWDFEKFVNSYMSSRFSA